MPAGDAGTRRFAVVWNAERGAGRSRAGFGCRPHWHRPGSLAGVMGVPWSSARRGEHQEKECSEKLMVRVTCLSPASSEVFRCREGLVQCGVGPGRFSSGEWGAAGAAGQGARTATVSLFYTT